MTFQSLHRVLGNLEQQYGPEARQFQQLLRHWPTVVGPIVAAQTRPVALQRGTLKVATSSTAWSQNLVFERQRILAKLQTYLPDVILDIRFSTAQWPPTTGQPGEVDLQTRLRQSHPSYIATSSSHPTKATPETPLDAKAAFQHWAERMQARSRHLPQCPQCQCPTPPGELERWSVCAPCATRQWQPHS